MRGVLKKKSLVLLLVIILFALGIIFYFIYSSPRFQKTSGVENIKKAIITQVEIPNNASIEKGRVLETLSILDDPKKTPEEKYEALTSIAFYFNYAYSVNNDPSLREFVNDKLNNLAKTNFPEQYKETDFSIGCADSKCGDELDPDIENILKNISTLSGVELAYKQIVSENLRQAAFTPSSQMEDKRTGMKLAVNQLERLNSPQASSAAQSIRKYFENKYKTAL